MILVAPLLLCCVLQAPAREPDAWFAEDKLKHLALSFAMTGMGYAAARSVSLRHEDALAGAVAGTLLAGLAKEIRDRRAGGRFSVRDLVYDALGVSLAVSLVARAAR